MFNFSKGVITFHFPIHLFTSTHTFSHYSYITLHYTLHPYILHLSNTYIYTLLTTQPLIKSTHKNPYEFNYLNTQTTPIPSSSSFSLPKQQKFFISTPQNPNRITPLFPSIFFTLFFYFHLLLSTYFCTY